MRIRKSSTKLFGLGCLDTSCSKFLKFLVDVGTALLIMSMTPGKLSTICLDQSASGTPISEPMFDDVSVVDTDSSANSGVI